MPEWELGSVLKKYELSIDWANETKIWRPLLCQALCLIEKFPCYKIVRTSYCMQTYYIHTHKASPWKDTLI